MSTLLNRIFIQHPQTVDETYFEHMRFAGWFAFKLLAAGSAALVHAIILAAFEKTAGNIICELHHRMENRH